MAKYTNKSKLLGKIGTENYRVSNCPVYLPKENIKFFMAMQDAGNKDPFSSDTWSNQIASNWKKPFHESVMTAISKGIKNALNESNGCRTDEECLRANLVCLYDHCDQQNFYIIKNPTVEDIKEIGEYHNRYYYKEKNSNPKDRIVAEFLEWAYYNIKLDGLTSIEYDDENINLCSFDLKNDEDLYKLAYDAYSVDESKFRHRIGWDRYNFNIDNEKIKYALNIIDQNILNKRDHYGFGLGTRLSFIEYFFEDYKDILDRYNNGDKEGDADWLKRIKEKEQILSSYETFKSYMKEQVKKSFCGGDSSSAILLLNLKTEQIFDQAPKTKIHFIKTFQEYKDEMYKILTKVHKIKESQEFDFNSNIILNEGTWGYEPNEGDGPLDMRFDINLSIFEKIYDKCKKDIDDAKKENYAPWAWQVIGQIEYFFDRATSLDNLADEPDKKFEKYDFWWKLKSRKKKDILELYKEALDICENDKKWINGWKEPKRMIASLKRRHKFLDKVLKIQEQKDNYEKKLKEKQAKNNKNIVSFPDVVEGFIFEGESCGECGGVGGSYNTPMNTVGVGNVVPTGMPAMTGVQQASDMFNGSGDLTIPKSQKKSKKNKSKNLGVTYFPLATKKGV